jgi:sugar phosphate isomerase/epimerase
VEKWPVGVFTSIDAGLGVSLDVAQELGVPTMQIHAPHKNTRTRQHAADFLARIGEIGITVTAVFGGFAGESYADIPTVERTVGLVPLETQQARLAEMKDISDFAALLGCHVIALHLGFVPEDRQSDSYKSTLDVVRNLCEYADTNAQNLHLETGQETAENLIRFIADSHCENLFVNFDPANMILYGTGEPIEALEKINGHVRSVHCKDAIWAASPGKEWGREVPLGEGDVGMRRYLETLKSIDYDGPLTIERELPQEPERQKAEIKHAVDLLEQLKREVLG